MSEIEKNLFGLDISDRALRLVKLQKKGKKIFITSFSEIEVPADIINHGEIVQPEKLIEAMCTIQSQSTSNPTSISQYAALAALTGDQGFIAEMCVEFKKRHDFVVAELNTIDGVECVPTDGTFYVFPNVEKLLARLDGIDDDLAFSDYLIEKAGVALVPGSAFGTAGHIRLSIATSMDNLKTALERIKQAI